MYRKSTLITLLLAFIVIVSASYLRLSDAGLGCEDWPACYGKAIDGNDAEYKSFTDALIANDSFAIVTDWKLISQGYVTGILAIMIGLLALVSWTQKQCRLAAMSTTMILLLLVCLQTALQQWASKVQLMPVFVTGQVLLGFIIFWLLFWIYLRLNPKLEIIQGTKAGPKFLARLGILVLFLQMLLGAWTSSNYAALACGDFPRCLDTWMPSVDYLSALNLFDGLINSHNSVLSVDGQVAIHWLHRVGALVSFILLTILIFTATAEKFSKAVRKAGVILSVLLLIQISLGVFSIKLELPLWIAIAHNSFAALLMLPLIAISFYSKYALVDDVQPAVKSDQVVEVEDYESDIESAVSVEDLYVEPTAESLYLRLKTQLSKTRTGLSGVLSSLSLGQKEINQDLLEDIESSLLMADIGVDATNVIISQLTDNLERHQLNDGAALEASLKHILLAMLQPSCQPLEIPKQETPFVILVVGINGVGKTTTIGKLAKRLQVQGHSVMLAAGDTFRAAAVEQLQTWGERNNIHVVAQHTGADSASVIYDGVQSAQAKGIDILIADTAGRLHTKSNLMDELSKIKRIIGKVDEQAPHEVLLVLDAGTGQNALSQTKIFNQVVELSGLVLTKLDGTAKGGVIFALARQFGLPIRFIGVGEGIDDLQDFDAKAFVDALFVKD